MMQASNNSSRQQRVDINATVAWARDRWPSVLERMGIPRDLLRPTHGPCPVCGGKDRFRFFEDSRGERFFCGQGKKEHRSGKMSGDACTLAMDYLRADFVTTMREVADIMTNGAASAPPVNPRPRPVSPSLSAAGDTAKVRALWAAGKPIVAGDPVSRYLAARGLTLPENCSSIRYHPKLPYWLPCTPSEAAQYPASARRMKLGDTVVMVLVGTFHAMLGAVELPNGEMQGVHRTYLTLDGHKADVVAPKKLMGKGVQSGAIRLAHAVDKLVVAEGIESALAAGLLTGRPAWATVSASMMEGLVIPPTVRSVAIFADRDQVDSHGQRCGEVAAKCLRDRLAKEGVRVVIHAAARAGCDANDVLRSRAS